VPPEPVLPPELVAPPEPVSPPELVAPPEPVLPPELVAPEALPAPPPPVAFGAPVSGPSCPCPPLSLEHAVPSEPTRAAIPIRPNRVLRVNIDISALVFPDQLNCVEL
jgi:hypothetical protein